MPLALRKRVGSARALVASPAPSAAAAGSATPPAPSTACCCAQQRPLAPAALHCSARSGAAFTRGRCQRDPQLRRRRRRWRDALPAGTPAVAAVIPGDTAAEFVVLDGTAKFFNLYNNLLIARVVLSWFPSAAQQPLLRPIFTVCDPFLNAFRGIIPSIGGIDLSPIIGFTLLSTMSQLTGALGAEMDRDVARSIRSAGCRQPMAAPARK